MSKHRITSETTADTARIDDTSDLRIRAIIRRRIMARDRFAWRAISTGLAVVALTGGGVAYASSSSEALEAANAQQPVEATFVTYKTITEESTSDDSLTTAENIGPAADAAAAKAAAEARAEEKATAEAAEAAKIAAEAEAAEIAAAEAAEAAAAAAAPDWSVPVEASVSSEYGMRWGTLHAGTDFAADTGTAVGAIGDGTVTFAGVNGGYGMLVVVEHANGIESYYAHNSAINVSVGDTVTQGETLSLIGSTGDSTGPHLHLEIHVDGTAVDPLAWLREEGVDI